MQNFNLKVSDELLFTQLIKTNFQIIDTKSLRLTENSTAPQQTNELLSRFLCYKKIRSRNIFLFRLKASIESTSLFNIKTM